MKKKILALLLGGVMAVGGLFMQVPVTAQAAELVRFEECEDSTSHIRSSQVAMVDGKLTVTIDLVFETENAQFYLYVYEKQLEKDKTGIFEFYPVYFVNPVTKLEKLTESGTYTFDNLASGKTYYVYCFVYDNHECHGWGEGGEPDDIYSHYATYLGSNGSASASSGSGSSGSAPSDSSNEPEKISYEDEVVSQIETAPSGSTIAMEKGISALSNSVMQELLAKGDVSLKLEFTYENKEYVIIIPAGAALDNDIPWYGPLYLAQHFGNRAGTNASAASGTGDTYEVKSGDSLSRIAAANHMTLKQLLAKNPQITDPNKIAVGQKINR